MIIATTATVTNSALAETRPDRAAVLQAAGRAAAAEAIPAEAAPPRAAAAKPLPALRGSVPVDRGRGVRPRRPGQVPAPAPQTSGQVPAPVPHATGQTPPGADPSLAVTARPAGTTAGKVALRALVVAVDESDIGLPNWLSVLDRVGAAYDVLYARTTPLTAARLVRADGVGAYNAVLLTSNSLLYPNGSGGYSSALSADQWNLLWSYERDYGVRQATLYISGGTWPEDYCVRAVSDGSLGSNSINVAITTDGRGVFDYLRSDAQIPVTQSYVYRTQTTSDCAVQPILTAGSDVLGAISTSTDGRQRLALTFSSSPNLLHSQLITYGLLRWASRGLYLGEQRHYLHIDVDDWFDTSARLFKDGHVEAPGFEMTARDATNVATQISILRSRNPQARDLTFTMAFNGARANPSVAASCSVGGALSSLAVADQLTAVSRCLEDRFDWVNHTATHPAMNFTDYARNYAEINNNLTIAAKLGLSVDPTILKTPEYSGLGVYNDDPTDAITPPTDHGLAASNPTLIQAAKDSGIRYMHGNMSFASHRPSCFNCNVTHPLEPSIGVVPDWPTNIAYHVTSPEEETLFYNTRYGPNGTTPYWPKDLTYSEILDREADVAILHVASGSIYTHTFHITNLRDYGNGSTLVSDWVARVLARYSSYYSVPVLSPGWTALAQYTSSRNSHFAALAAGVDAVYDPATDAVSVTAPVAATATVTGVRAGGASWGGGSRFGGDRYGNEVSTPVTVTAGQTVTVSVVR